MLAMAEDTSCSAMQVLERFNITTDEVISAMKNILDSATPDLKGDSGSYGNNVAVPLQSTERIMRSVKLEAQSMKCDQIHTAHLLLAVMREDSTKLSYFFAEKGVSYEKAKEEAGRFFNVIDNGDDDSDGPFASSNSEDNRKKPNQDTPRKNVAGSDTL